MPRVSTTVRHVSIADVTIGHVSASHSSTSAADVSRGSDFLPRQRHVAPRGSISFAGAAPAQPATPATRPLFFDVAPPRVETAFVGPRRLCHAAGDHWPTTHARVALKATSALSA